MRDVYTTSAPALQPDDANGGWLTVLNEIAALRAADPEVRHYYGVVRIGYSSGLAGLGFIGVGAAIGYDREGDRERIAAHELGHTWGREHAPCGNPSGPDPSYPLSQRQDRTDRLGPADRRCSSRGSCRTSWDTAGIPGSATTPIKG